MVKFKTLKKLFLIMQSVFMVTALCSCSELKLTGKMSSDILIEINDETCSSAEGVFRLMEVIESYGDTDEYFFERTVGDLSMEEYLKESVKEEMIKLVSVTFIADELAIYLTDDEISEAYQAAYEAYAEISAKYDVASYNITESDAASLYEKQALYEKVYSELTDSVTMEISETDTKVIEVNFVLFPEETTIAEAEAFRVTVSGGTDFEEACTDAGYEPYMNITLKKGDMVSAFENVAFALDDGELSECTETVDGIYLIECVEDYLETESLANYNSVIAAAKDEIFQEKYDEFANGTELRFNTDFWESISAVSL